MRYWADRKSSTHLIDFVFFHPVESGARILSNTHLYPTRNGDMLTIERATVPM